MENRPARIATQSVARLPKTGTVGQAGGEKTTAQLEEDLRKTREELAIQKWGIEKTLGGMKVLVKELIQKGEEAEETRKQVEKKLTEVERLNKVMIGRELKMIELKKAIEELRAKLPKA